jgi:glycosyltransferase involved in cell wall biosynthesis
VIGSHPTREAIALHAPERGLHVHGHASDAALAEALRGARALLAPLRFGAGLKGKVVEAWAHGTPVVTTPIGAEGMVPGRPTFESMLPDVAPDHPWGGLWRAHDTQTLVRDAVSVHTDRALWEACSQRALTLRGSLFGAAPLLARLRRTIEAVLEARDERRAADYVGAQLWHHRQRSTEYFAKWIEAKSTGIR